MADLTPDLQVCLSWGSIAESVHFLRSLSVSCFHVILGGPRFPSTYMSKAVKMMVFKFHFGIWRDPWGSSVKLLSMQGAHDTTFKQLIMYCLIWKTRPAKSLDYLKNMSHTHKQGYWRCYDVKYVTYPGFENTSLLIHLCRVDSSTLTLWTGPFLIEGVSGKFFLLRCFTEIPVFKANSVDTDQMPHFAASDLGLHCLPISLFM